MLSQFMNNSYPSENLHLSAEDVSGNTQRHVPTQESADDAEPTFISQAPGIDPSLVGRTPRGPA